MKKKEIEIILKFDNKGIKYNMPFEDSKDEEIVKITIKRLIMSIEGFRKKRLSQLDIWRVANAK